MNKSQFHGSVVSAVGHFVTPRLAQALLGNERAEGLSLLAWDKAQQEATDEADFGKRLIAYTASIVSSTRSVLTSESQRLSA